MTIIKRCEKEVPGEWEDKRRQFVTWLDHFVPHYSHRCLRDDGCPAMHGDTVQKNYLDENKSEDRVRIKALLELVGKMKRDVASYLHGYHTCAVECAHGERTVHTNKRIEYWSNWEGKCRLVQLLHNIQVRATGDPAATAGMGGSGGGVDAAGQDRPR